MNYNLVVMVQDESGYAPHFVEFQEGDRDEIVPHHIHRYPLE